MTKIDIYTRVSSKSDRQARSTDGQEADCRDRVARGGATVGRVFCDPALSAWNPRVARPDWDALMDRLERGASDGVCVFDLARFARRPADGERLIAAAERGLTVLDAGSEYDLNSASGRKNFRDQMNAAAFYSDEISERTRRGKRLKAQLGEVDCRRSFGFEGNGIDVRTSEADVIREMAGRLLDGETQDALMAELTERGVGTIRGAKWGYTTFRQIMTKPKNAGLIQHNGRVVDGVRLPGEPILDMDTYNRIVALYASRRPGRQPSGKYLLTGIALCACGSRLAGRPVSGTARRQYWCKNEKCPNRTFVDAARLDDWASDWTVRTLSDPEHAESIARAEREKVTRVTDLSGEIAAIEADALAIADRFGRGELTLARYDAICNPLDARLAKLRAELENIERSMILSRGVRTIPQRDADRLGVLERWDAGSVAERRAMVVSALRGSRLVVGPGRPAAFDAGRVTVG